MYLFLLPLFLAISTAVLIPKQEIDYMSQPGKLYTGNVKNVGDLGTVADSLKDLACSNQCSLDNICGGFYVTGSSCHLVSVSDKTKTSPDPTWPLQGPTYYIKTSSQPAPLKELPTTTTTTTTTITPAASAEELTAPEEPASPDEPTPAPAPAEPAPAPAEPAPASAPAPAPAPAEPAPASAPAPAPAEAADAPGDAPQEPELCGDACPKFEERRWDANVIKFDQFSGQGIRACCMSCFNKNGKMPNVVDSNRNTKTCKCYTVEPGTEPTLAKDTKYNALWCTVPPPTWTGP